MSQQTYVVAFDGHDINVVDVAATQAQISEAALVVVHVLHWSPYSFLAPDELAARHKARQEELERAESDILKPVIDRLNASGQTAAGIARHGQPADVIIEEARARNADMIFVGRSSSFSSRMFGSITSALSQESPIPVVIVP